MRNEDIKDTLLFYTKATHEEKARLDCNNDQSVIREVLDRVKIKVKIKQRRKPYNKNLRRMYKYMITKEQLESLLKRNKCDICGRVSPGPKKIWHIDHDHITKKVRGLLCHRCNCILLPAVEKGDDILDKARNYLINPPGC